MIEPKPSSIGEAPSLADITSAGDRVGKVDFTTRLGDRMTEPDPDEEAAPSAAVLSLASMARLQRPADAETDAPSMPFILPPAKVGAAMAAEAERARLEVAAARGELPDDEPELDDEPEPDVQDEHEEQAEDVEPEVVETAVVVEPEVEQPAEPVVEAPAPSPSPSTVEVIAVARIADVAKATEAARAAKAAEAAEAARVEAAATAEVARVVAAADAAIAAADKRSAEPAEPAEPVEPETPQASRALESLVIQDVADFAAVAAQVAQLEAEEAGRADAEEVARLEAETEAAASAAEAALARVAAIDTAAYDQDPDDAPNPDGVTDYGYHGDFDDDLSDLEAPDHARGPSDAPLRSVTEVADTVIAAMHRINQAHELHVESLELETARRCELLTAQAELDAELIRLHARREAHAIITAARTRSGEHDAGSVESDQLGEIGETFSRFAETIETTVAPGPGSPDHLRKS